jgi:hypothetical protein
MAASYAASAGALASLSPEARLMLTSGARAEELASDILARKRMLVELDRQRQDCVQALATLRDKPSSSASSSPSSSPRAGATASAVLPSALHAPPPSALWVSLSGNFVRLPRAGVREALQADKQRLDDEIERVRTEMKDRMKQLQHVAPAVGLDKGTLDFALS